MLAARALVPTGEGVADRLPHPEAGGGSEGAPVLRVLHQGEEEQRGVCHCQHRRDMHHLGPCVGTWEWARRTTQLLNKTEHASVFLNTREDPKVGWFTLFPQCCDNIFGREAISGVKVLFWLTV